MLRRLLGVIYENMPGALEGTDPEYLHQLRIAVRRSRTVQRQLRGVFPALELPGFRSEFRWLQRVTGDARDLDVYVEELDSWRGCCRPRSVAISIRCARCSPTADWPRAPRWPTALRSARVAGAARGLGAAARVARRAAARRSPVATRPLGAVVGRRIRKVYGRVLTMGAAIDDDSPAADYHELRKKGKELRYLLELFAVQSVRPGGRLLGDRDAEVRAGRARPPPGS